MSAGACDELPLRGASIQVVLSHDDRVAWSATRRWLTLQRGLGAGLLLPCRFGWRRMLVSRGRDGIGSRGQGRFGCESGCAGECSFAAADDPGLAAGACADVDSRCSLTTAEPSYERVSGRMDPWRLDRVEWDDALSYSSVPVV